jgi:hypothetical protein
VGGRPASTADVHLRRGLNLRKDYDYGYQSQL